MLYRNLTVGIDGSASSLVAFGHALDLAAALHLPLTVLAVAPPLSELPARSAGNVVSPPEETPRFQAELLDRLKHRAKVEAGVEVRTLHLHGPIVPKILEYLEGHDVDLMVVGARGLSAGRRLLLGSVSDSLARQAPCPVLIVRSREKP